MNACTRIALTYIALNERASEVGFFTTTARRPGVVRGLAPDFSGVAGWRDHIKKEFKTRDVSLTSCGMSARHVE